MEKQNKGTMSKLYNFAEENKGKIITSVILAILGVAFGMIPYLCTAKLLALFYSKQATFKLVLILCLIAIVSYALKAWFATISTMKSHEAAFTILKNIRLRLTEKMERVPMGVMLETPSGTYKSMVVDMVDKIEKPLAHMIPELTSNMLVPIIIFITMFIIDWRMGLAALAVIPLGLIIIMGQMIGYKEKSKKFYSSSAKMNDTIVEYINGIEVIKAFNRSAGSYGRYEKATKYYKDYTIKWWKSCWIFSATGYSVITSTLIVLLPVGAYLFMNGKIEFAPFITCVILSLGIAGPIMSSLQFIDTYSNIYQCINQVYDFLNKEELIRPTENVELNDDGFKFENVSFSYDDTEVLHNINLESVSKGMTAIVGPSGGGKSTIAKLMAGFWDPTKGNVTFGGKNIREIPFNQYMSQISYVAQDNFLFDNTILENIRIGKKYSTDEEVINAAKKAGCHEFINLLPNGYQTKVGDSGGKLSGGERQRITIARAILKNADTIILDEATAYADPENEAEIQLAISKLISGKNLIVIAHRLSTIVNADKIVVVEKGNIINEGTQKELLENCPLYQRMWNNHISSLEEMEVTVCSKL